MLQSITRKVTNPDQNLSLCPSLAASSVSQGAENKTERKVTTLPLSLHPRCRAEEVFPSPCAEWTSSSCRLKRAFRESQECLLLLCKQSFKWFGCWVSQWVSEWGAFLNTDQTEAAAIVFSSLPLAEQLYGFVVPAVSAAKCPVRVLITVPVQKRRVSLAN